MILAYILVVCSTRKTIVPLTHSFPLHTFILPQLIFQVSPGWWKYRISQWMTNTVWRKSFSLYFLRNFCPNVHCLPDGDLLYLLLLPWRAQTKKLYTCEVMFK